jgi:parallel beta-helix repeat protein
MLFKKVISIIVMVLILNGILIPIFKIQRVNGEWTGTVYIRADGSIDPREAPIITYDNVTYTLTGDIISSADGIVVERSDIVIDGANYMLKGKGNETGIYLGGISAVIIQNIGITGFYYGIYLYDSFGNTISESNITNNKYGIYHSSSSYNTITRDQVTDNDCGIFLDSSSNNVISANNITNSEFGIGIESSYSFNNSVVGNIFTGCGLLLPPGNRVENNTVNGKPLVYLESVSDFNVEEAGQVILFDCNNIRVKNLNLSNASLGLMLWNTNNSVITNITANNNCYGIMLINSTDNTIFGNYMANNYHGIWLESSSNNHIAGNNISENKYIGVALTSSSCFNRISGNNISATGYYGLVLGESSNNNWISGNNMENNEYGIALGNSSNNNIYHNNFVNNTRQVYDVSWDDPQFPPSTNIWDDGYPAGGNFWSDYTGVDEKSGPNQDQPGGDGIGDTPYIIDENNVDQYPLMSPYKCGVPVEDPSVSKLAFKVSIEPTGKSEPDEWSFRIVLWDITKRAPDIISLFSQFPGVDLFVSAWDIIVSDKNGDGHLDANEVLDELASQLKDKLTRKIIEQSLSRYLWPLSPEAVEHASEIFTVGLASVIGTVAATEVIQSAASIGFFTGTYSFGIPLLGYQELSGLWEKFPFGGFSGFQQYQVSALSPVDLTVSDIFGRVINKTICEIPSADYKEFDANGDGDIDVVITLPSINMKYNLTVTPKTGAAPNDDYSVIVENNYISFQIVNSTVAEIPEGGYNAALYTYNPSTYEALEIGYPIQDPLEKIEPYQNVTITVSAISRESEIVNVTLYFSLDNGTTWMPIKMTETVLNIYQAIIPGQQNDTWISYYFVAYDNTGNFTIRDNNGYYYQFYVVPEFPSIVMWLLLMLATLTSIVLAQKREKTNSHS